MERYTSLTDISPPKQGTVLAIGNFDGVHVGHQAIIAKARELARQNALPLWAMTFDPAPVKILRPELAPRILTPIQVKSCLLEQQGIDALIVIQTDREFLAQEAADFVEKIAVERLAVKHIVEGESFSFGRRRQGSMSILQEMGRQHGFQAHLVPSQKLKLPNHATPIVVSSTFIRQQISQGQFGEVKQCLGRFYDIAGQVVRGQGRGHRIGFPTANLRLYDHGQLIPTDGVYAGYVRLGESAHALSQSHTYYPAALSIGDCETFADGQWQIEAHLLDFQAEQEALYGRQMSIALVERIRRQEKYDSAEALIEAIENDCRKVRLALLSKGDQN